MSIFDFLRRSREKAVSNQLSSVSPGSGGWINIVRESFSGAWQRNIEIRTDTVLTYSAVYRCISLISSDIAKMRMRLVVKDSDDIWKETSNPAFSPVLRRPNRYQNRIQFFSAWVESKLIHGNSYVLKERDARNVVTGMHVLSPELVTVLVAPDGAVYYELRSDFLAGLPSHSFTVPASEIVHDRMNATFNHPLIGISPITACGLAAMQGLKITESSTQFFANGSQPSGLVTVPTSITPDKARQLQEIWDSRKPGTTAVLDNGAAYTPMTITAADAQLLEQLKWTAETVASVFGVPAFKIGVGPLPTYNNVESLDSQYYSQCLQIHIEAIEECLDQGLGLGPNFGNAYGTEFDLDGLLRMDTSTKVKAAAEGVKAGFLAPNEARWKFDLSPVEGGDSPYLQVQNYSLAALDRRDSKENPVTPGVPAVQPPQETPADGSDSGDQTADADERSRSVIHLADLIERQARAYERRSTA